MSDNPEFHVSTAPIGEDAGEDQELERIRHYSACFSGPSGEYVLKDLMQLAGIGGSVFRQTEFDTLKAAHLDGSKAVVWRCMNYSGKRIFDL